VEVLFLVALEYFIKRLLDAVGFSEYKVAKERFCFRGDSIGCSFGSRHSSGFNILSMVSQTLLRNPP